MTIQINSRIDLPKEVSVNYDDGDSSNSQVGISLQPKLDDASKIDRHFLRNFLIGICSSLAVVLIGVLIFLLHRSRYMFERSFLSNSLQ